MRLLEKANAATMRVRNWNEAHDAPIEMITTAEQNEFRLIVKNAKTEGWLELDDEVSATFAGPSVLIRCTRRGGRRREQSYAHRSCWPFEFLRDLAHGIWKGVA